MHVTELDAAAAPCLLAEAGVRKVGEQTVVGPEVALVEKTTVDNSHAADELVCLQGSEERWGGVLKGRLAPGGE